MDNLQDTFLDKQLEYFKYLFKKMVLADDDGKQYYDQILEYSKQTKDRNVFKIFLDRNPEKAEHFQVASAYFQPEIKDESESEIEIESWDDPMPKNSAFYVIDEMEDFYNKHESDIIEHQKNLKEISRLEDLSWYLEEQMSKLDKKERERKKEYNQKKKEIKLNKDKKVNKSKGNKDRKKDIEITDPQITSTHFSGLGQTYQSIANRGVNDSLLTELQPQIVSNQQTVPQPQVSPLQQNQFEEPSKKVMIEAQISEPSLDTQNPYEAYWAEFLPEMAKKFREYNKRDADVAKMSDFEILQILFPNVTKEGDYPDLEMARETFATLASVGRPYVQGFNPPLIELVEQEGNETLEIIHRGNHFNRLVRTDNQPELEKDVEDERTSIDWRLQQFTEEKSQLQAFLLASVNEEDIAQCYDAFILPFIKELALKGIVDGYYAKSPNWSSYAALKKALKSEVDVNFQDPVSLLRRYLPAAANPLFVQLEPKAGKEEAERAVQQQREADNVKPELNRQDKCSQNQI